MTTSRWLAGALLVLGTACPDSGPLTFSFDSEPHCRPGAEVELASVLPAVQVIAVVADGDTNPGAAWVVATETDNTSRMAHYMVHRVAGSHDPDAMDPVRLPVGPAAEGDDPDRLTFVPGPSSGEAWLLVARATSTDLYVFDQDFGLRPGSHDVHDLTAATDSSESDGGRRDLLFVASQPYLSLTPGASKTADFRLSFTALSPSLTAIHAQQLHFALSGCHEDDGPEGYCDGVSFPAIKVSSVKGLPSTSVSTLAVHTVVKEAGWDDDDDDDDYYYYSQRSVLKLREEAGLLRGEWQALGYRYEDDTHEGEGSNGAQIPDIQFLDVAIDGFSTFVLSGKRDNLLRIDDADGTVTPYAVPGPGMRRLAQLRTQSAILHTDELGLQLTLLTDLREPTDTLWNIDPSQEGLELGGRYSILKLPGAHSVQAAGRGRFLVSVRNAAPQLVHIGCLAQH
ncbi:MAG: hypothetical protein V3V08_00500 [Nannocystaceae bacterium]